MGAGEVEVYWLDTSLILRLLTGEPPELAQQALEVFAEAETGQYILRVHPLVVAEAFYTLRSFYKLPKAAVAQSLLELFDREGLELQEEEAVRYALQEAAHNSLSYVDAHLLQSAHNTGGGIATLDKQLAKRAAQAHLKAGYKP